MTKTEIKNLGEIEKPSKICGYVPVEEIKIPSEGVNQSKPIVMVRVVGEVEESVIKEIDKIRGQTPLPIMLGLAAKIGCLQLLNTMQMAKDGTITRALAKNINREKND